MSDFKKFFLEEIPEAFAGRVESLRAAAEAAREGGNNEKADKLERKLEDLEDAEATLRMEITGDEGRDFYFNYYDGELWVADAAESEPIAWFTQSVADFDALQAAGVNPLAGGDKAEKAGTKGLGLINPALADKVRDLDVVMKVVLSDLPSGGEGGLMIRLGSAATSSEPAATIRVAYNDFKEMASGAIAPPQAFMQGKIRVEGDMSLLMRLTALAG